MRQYLVCYDIEDNRERRLVSRCLEGYGRRVQKSVFEVSFPKHRDNMSEMLERLLAVVEYGDSIRIYRLSGRRSSDSQMIDGSPIKPPASALIYY